MLSLNINEIYLAIAFVILVTPFAFYRFTRLENPEDNKNISSFKRIGGLILGLLGLPLYFGICAFISSFAYLQSYPRREIFGMDGAEWGGYMQGDVPEYFGILVVVGMLLFAASSIWFLVVFSQRWEAKVWEDPGNNTSKALRAVSYFMHVYLSPLVLAIGLGVLLYFFHERFLENLGDIPRWITRLINRRTISDDDQGLLLGFGIIGFLDALFVLWGLVGLIRAVISSFWPRLEATIVQSELYSYVTWSGRSRSRNYRFIVEYSYLVDGMTYTGTRVSYNMRWLYENKPYIWFQTKRYPIGATVSAYVNPNKPEDAVLEAGIDWFGLLNWGLQAAVVFVLISTFLLPS